MILKLLPVQKRAMNRGCITLLSKVTQVLKLNDLLSEFQCTIMMKRVIMKLMYTP